MTWLVNEFGGMIHHIWWLHPLRWLLNQTVINSLNALPSCVITQSMRKTQADDKLESKVVSKTIEIPSVLSVTG